MEADKLETVEDLEAAYLQDENLELINGTIVKRPMATSEHSAVQADVCGLLGPLRSKRGSNSWWFMLAISVRYNEHQ